MDKRISMTPVDTVPPPKTSSKSKIMKKILAGAIAILATSAFAEDSMPVRDYCIQVSANLRAGSMTLFAKDALPRSGDITSILIDSGMVEWVRTHSKEPLVKSLFINDDGKQKKLVMNGRVEVRVESLNADDFKVIFIGLDPAFCKDIENTECLVAPKSL